MSIDCVLGEDFPILNRFDPGRIGLSVINALKAVDVTQF